MKYTGRFLTSLVILFLLGTCSIGSAVEVGQNAPDFTLTNMGGQKASLADFKGKAIILNFFASWCPPCRG